MGVCEDGQKRVIAGGPLASYNLKKLLVLNIFFLSYPQPSVQ